MHIPLVMLLWLHEQRQRARRRRGIRPLILININASTIYTVV
jgi:hypothetical protein